MIVPLENRFHSEQTVDHADRPTILRFANDTIDEPVCTIADVISLALLLFFSDNWFVIQHRTRKKCELLPISCEIIITTTNGNQCPRLK